MSDQPHRKNILAQRNIDPAVAASLSDSAQREQRRQMTPPQRNKARRDKARISRRIYIDAPGDEIAAQLRATIHELADAVAVSDSQLGTFALVVGLQVLRHSQIDLDGYRQPALRSLNYQWELDIERLVKSGAARSNESRSETPTGRQLADMFGDE